jgi:hypothetical protein
MSIQLTREQREVMAQSEAPLRFVDPESKREYVLLRAELYERLWRIAQFEGIDPSLYEFEEPANPS